MIAAIGSTAENDGAVQARRLLSGEIVRSLVLIAAAATPCLASGAYGQPFDTGLGVYAYSGEQAGQRPAARG